MQLLLKLKTRELFSLFMALILLQSFVPKLSDLFIILTISFWIGWVFTIGIVMNSLIPPGDKFKTAYFKFSCLFIIVVVAGSEYLDTYLFKIGAYQSINNLRWVMTAIICYNLWSLLYVISFSARVFESAISDTKVGFFDLVKAFFCFMIFPIGVWLIQPAAQQVVAKSEVKINTNS